MKEPANTSVPTQDSPSTRYMSMAEFARDLQHSICTELASLDHKSFLSDSWTRPEGGGGTSNVLMNGSVFEKAGVNVSEIHGQVGSSEQAIFAKLLAQQDLDPNQALGARYFATGISLVIHPKNPFIPTTHANYRYFEMALPDTLLWWFGGGADLTPYYFFEEDAKHFHRTYQHVCERYNPSFYPDFKSDCDQYFYLPHRQEHRGIGGIFFDYLNNSQPSFMFDFVQACGNNFIESYVPIVKKRLETPYTDHHRNWQAIRRGRYVEFNLVYDRGTVFGLKTNGRIESILMSLPPQVQWPYNYHPEPDSPESELLSVLSSTRDWV